MFQQRRMGLEEFTFLIPVHWPMTFPTWGVLIWYAFVVTTRTEGQGAVTLYSYLFNRRVQFEV